MSAAVPEQYVFITPVWGERYVERFVKVSLPTQLSEGNLGAAAARASRYLIYTFPEDAPAIKRSQAFRRLKSLIPVSIRSLADLPRFGDNYPHDLQTAAYHRGIESARGHDAAYIFFTPDIVLSDGSIRTLIERAESGARVVLTAGIRMTAEGAVECVSAHRRPGQCVAPVPPREAVRALLDHPHPISLGHFVQPDGAVQIAQNLYWRVGSHGLLARGFHLHPLLVWPRVPEARIRITLDEEYVERACPDPADWHTVADSDELCMLEFSDCQHKEGMLANDPIATDDAVRAFMRGSVTAAHRRHALHRLRFHANDLDPAEWAEAELHSDGLIERYLRIDAEVEQSARVEVVESPTPPALRPNLLRKLSRAIVRKAYYLLNYPLYQYLGRMNAEIIHLRAVLAQTTHQLENVSRILDRQVRDATKRTVPPRIEMEPRRRKSRIALKRDTDRV